MSELQTYFECGRCGFRGSGSHTCTQVPPFPRGPSNEQTLLTELKKFKDFVAKNHPEVVEEYDKS